MVSDNSPTAIAKLNDELRKSVPAFPTPHRLVMTAAVFGLPSDVLDRMFERIRTFSSFNRDNDPHREHDFGAIDLGGVRYIWKFDYYDDAFEHHAENGIRVLTIMPASEY